jgi:hypothetical protein
MPYINTYITTNWDRIIEEECCAKPFVYDSDLRFWDVPERKVLKIHGTIDDYSSMIVTRDDYDRSLERLKISLLGGKLKEILANRCRMMISKKYFHLSGILKVGFQKSTIL